MGYIFHIPICRTYVSACDDMYRIETNVLDLHVIQKTFCISIPFNFYRFVKEKKFTNQHKEKETACKQGHSFIVQ